MPFIFRLSPSVADAQAPGLPHRAHGAGAHGAGAHGSRRDLLPCGVMATALPNPGITRLRCPEIGDRLHGLAVVPLQAPLRVRPQSGGTNAAVATPRHGHDVAGDLLFLAAWDKGEIPELWAYLRARQLRRAGAMAADPA